MRFGKAVSGLCSTKVFALGCALATTMAGCGSYDETAEIASTEDMLTADAQVTDGTLACDGATSVQVTISGANITSVTPVDLMLVVDESGSITTAQFEAQRAFLLDVVNGVTPLFANGGRVGISMFSTGSRIIQPLTSDKDQVLSSIQNVKQATGYTCIACGLEDARNQFGAAPTNRNRIAIVVTDGVANRTRNGQSAQGAVDTDLAQKVLMLGGLPTEIFAIGVGSSISQPQLESIATGTGSHNVYMVSDYATLDPILLPLVSAVVEPEATDALLELDVNDSFLVTGASADVGSVVVDGGTISWSIPQILDQTVTLTYRVAHQPRALGGNKPIHESVQYSDAEGNELIVPNMDVVIQGCDGDSDGVVDEDDACLSTSAGETVNGDGCSIEQLCPCDGDFSNHGAYQSCIADASRMFVRAGLITQNERSQIVTAAARSECGKN